tara:strand:- start:18075 stop:22538 length:4464 start_codon:yes stop_codon:yes gene_type:complete
MKSIFKIKIVVKYSVLIAGLICISADSYGQINQVKYLAYDSYGNPVKIQDANSNVTKYYFGSNTSPFSQDGMNGTNGIYLTGIVKLTGDGDSLTVLAKYNNLGLLTELFDENDQKSSYSYDDFGRLEEVRNSAGQLVEDYQYEIGYTGGTYTELNSNYIRTGRYDGSSTRESVEYMDGLGRLIQTQQKEGLDKIISAIEYDSQGREWKTWKPSRESGQISYVESFDQNISTYYYHNYPYMEHVYEQSPLGRISKTIPEGGESESGAIVHSYGIGSGSLSDYMYKEVTNEEGTISRTYTDGWGRDVFTHNDIGGENARTEFIYDEQDQLREVRHPNYFNVPQGGGAPEDWVSTYDYDQRGLLTKTETPDAGIVQFKYDKAGNLRFSQDARQAKHGIVAYTTYDFDNRPLISGEAAYSFGNLNGFNSYGFELSTANWLNINAYDEKPSTTSYPWNLFSAKINAAVMDSLKGKLAASAVKSDSIWQVTLYDYHREGWVKTKYVYTEGESSLDTKFIYEYNRLGELVFKKTEVEGDTLSHFYEYDLTGNLKQVHAGSSSGQPDVQYSYDPTGQMNSKQFKGLDATQFQYTIRGWMEEIGDNTLPFSAEYEYLKDGNIETADYRNQQISTTPYEYQYGYDGLSRLTDAAVVNGSGVVQSHRERSTYKDTQGNRRFLYRSDNSNQEIDNLSYHYLPGTNKITRVDHIGNNNTEGYDDRNDVIDSWGYDLDVIISQVHYNSEYDDDNYGAGEFIVAKNISGETINLKDWQLEDLANTDQTYKVLDDFYVQHNQSVVFANNQDTEYSENYGYAYDFDLRDNTGQTGLVLRLKNDSGNDNVLALRNPAGNLVDYVSWGGNFYGGYTWNVNQGSNENVAIHREEISCDPDCSKPSDWTVVARDPYVQKVYASSTGLEIIISQVHYDSEHDGNYGAAEYIELKNISGETINLQNWQLEDLSNPAQKYKVLGGFDVEPGQRVVFANDQHGLYSEHYRYGYDFNLRDNSGQGALVLRMSNDYGNVNEIALRNPSGTIVDYVSWGGNTHDGYTWNTNQEGDETVALHRSQVNCTPDCSKPADWTVAPRAPYGQDFYYDENGNLTIDKDKGLALGEPQGLHLYYNHQNQPVRVGNDITYRYNAAGQRYYKNLAGTEEYYVMDDDLTMGVFTNTGSGWELEHWNIVGNGVEGRVDNSGGKRYYYKDHLGSTRTVVNATGTVLQATDYYPFGLFMDGRSYISGTPAKEGFTGKERDDETGYDYFGARFYRADAPGFLQVDPLANEFPGWSTYNYTMNNPLRYIDPTGMAPLHTIVTENEDGTYSVVGGDPSDGDTGIYVGSTNGEKIGESLTTHSFFDANDNAVLGAQIDLNNTEGQDFLDNEIIGDNPSLATYTLTDDGGGYNDKLDFKNRGVDERGVNTSVQQHRYRGGVTKDGKIASARDFGNVAAGIVAGRNGVSSQVSRLAFDIYNGGREPKVTRLAQNVGLRIGHNLFIRELKITVHD